MAAKGKYIASQYVRIEVTVYAIGNDYDTAAAKILMGGVDTGAGGLIVPFKSNVGNFVTFRSTPPGTARGARLPNVSGFSYSHALNTSSATCSVQIKARGKVAEALLDYILPNYWVDVTVMGAGGVGGGSDKHHVFRGRVMGSGIDARAGTVDGGATEHVFTMQCRGFGYILEQHQVFYDIVSEGVDMAAAYPHILISPDNKQTVKDTCKSLLDGFLIGGPRLTATAGAPPGPGGRSPWEMPSGMNTKKYAASTVAGGRTYFRDTLLFLPDSDSRAIVNYPPRINSQSLSWLSPARGGESLWTILQRWNDNPLCDLYTDLVDRATGQFLVPGVNSDPETTTMALILRDKPFPTGTSPLRPGVPTTGMSVARDSPWFNEKRIGQELGYLPTYTIQWSDMVGRSVARSDAARKNAFFIAPVLTAGLTGTLLDIQSPLWDLIDIQRHGFRPNYYVTPYLLDIYSATTAALPPTPPGGGSSQDWIQLLNTYRERLRDYLCLGAEYLSGTISLGIGRPDIRVGGKLNIETGRAAVSANSYERSEQYYIEAVSHHWAPVVGMRTELTVTRGLRGGNAERIRALDAVRRPYTIGKKEASSP